MITEVLEDISPVAVEHEVVEPDTEIFMSELVPLQSCNLVMPKCQRGLKLQNGVSILFFIDPIP